MRAMGPVVFNKRDELRIIVSWYAGGILIFQECDIGCNIRS